MSYERDKDADTRGVGAIAALDKGNRARRAHRYARARELNARDGRLAKMTYRPGGGIAHEGLGRVSLAFTKQVGVGTGSGVGERTPGASRPPVATTPSTGAAGGGGIVKQPSRLYGGAGTVAQRAPVVSFQMVTKQLSQTVGATPGSGTRRPANQSAGQLGPVLPLPTPPGAIVQEPTDTTSSSSGGGYTGGGGGGGGAGYSPTTPAYPGMEPPSMPDLEVEEPTSGPDLKTIALVGGAAVAAWWIFFRKKGSAPP